MGHLMADGAGVEYYFGYKFAENNLVCEDWRSRDQSWDYCAHALRFFRDQVIPFQTMTSANRLVGNDKNDNSRYCFPKPGAVYLVYLPKVSATMLDLSGQSGKFSVRWFNPRTGGEVSGGSVLQVAGGSKVDIGGPKGNANED